MIICIFGDQMMKMNRICNYSWKAGAIIDFFEYDSVKQMRGARIHVV